MQGPVILEDFLKMTPDSAADKYLGVIEFENYKMLGWLEDPNDLETKVRLLFPIEVREVPNVANTQAGISLESLGLQFVRPPLGIPYEYIADSSADIVTYRMKTNIGLLYRSALEKFSVKPVEIKPSMIDKLPQPKQPTNNQQPRQ